MQTSLSPSVNTDVKMPKTMMVALSTHEAHCVASRIDSVTEGDVIAFLEKHFSAKLAAKFKPEFLFSIQAT